MFRLSLCTLLCLAAGAIAIPADATTALQAYSVSELTNRSTLVLRGRIDRIESFQQGAAIFTDIELNPLETWKGDAPTGRVQLRVYGGSYDGIRTTVIGAPCWSEGEESVLFLVPNGPSTYDVLALAQGKFVVTAGGTLERDLSGIAFAQPATEIIPETVPALKAAVLDAIR